jgi:hypothetical protein
MTVQKSYVNDRDHLRLDVNVRLVRAGSGYKWWHA